MLRAWVDEGLLYIMRNKGGVTEHAMMTENEHIVWIKTPQLVSDVFTPGAFLDLERAQINAGRKWPPREKPVTL